MKKQFKRVDVGELPARYRHVVEALGREGIVFTAE